MPQYPQRWSWPQVTVVVHSHGSCALEKTYEAQLRDLPSVFKDGTTSAGRGVELTTPELDLVELTLYHAGVRLRIRQHGDFLSVTLRMPTQIADMGTPLCSQVRFDLLACASNNVVSSCGSRLAPDWPEVGS